MRGIDFINFPFSLNRDNELIVRSLATSVINFEPNELNIIWIHFFKSQGNRRVETDGKIEIILIDSYSSLGSHEHDFKRGHCTYSW